jgi:8-oxo-dGTP pyrophosphatase MutT (NUDIX family)
LKEVLEEYGCEGVIQEELPPLDIFREHNGNKTHWLAVPFFILVNQIQEAKNNEPDKMEEIGWFKLDEFPAPLHQGFEMQFAALKDYFEKYR